MRRSCAGRYSSRPTCIAARRRLRSTSSTLCCAFRCGWRGASGWALRRRRAKDNEPRAAPPLEEVAPPRQPHAAGRQPRAAAARRGDLEPGDGAFPARDPALSAQRAPARRVHHPGTGACRRQGRRAERRRSGNRGQGRLGGDARRAACPVRRGVPAPGDGGQGDAGAAGHRQRDAFRHDARREPVACRPCLARRRRGRGDGIPGPAAIHRNRVHPLSRRYLFGGLAINSDVALAGMRSATDTGSHDVRLSFHQKPAPSADRETFVWDGRYGVRLGTLGDAWHLSSQLDGIFIVDRAVTQIDFYADAESPTPAAVDVQTRRILPRLATLTGALTVHGAAMRRDGGAIVMFGKSGAGKSPLTAALALAGWHIASDDLTMIRPAAAGAMVHPGATGVCLWADTRAALALDPARCLAMPGYEGKLRFEPEDLPGTKPAPLRAATRRSGCCRRWQGYGR